MNFDYSDEENAFREQVKTIMAEKLPKEIAQKNTSGQGLSKVEIEQWHAILNAQGWLAQGWPVDFGGTGWTPIQKHIFEEERVAAGGPEIIPFGLSMLAPVLIAFGSDEQKKEILPRILNGDDWWCQGYSEPGAGSDLASLKTRAVRDGDNYIVNGQKTWTTLGQYANKIFSLVRTSTEGKPQQGISFLLMDMDAPGVTIRPIRTIDGDYEVNEVFFEDVRVPAKNLVGKENMGWTYAKFLLTHERTGIAGVPAAKNLLKKLKAVAAETEDDAGSLMDDPLFAARIAQVEIDLIAMELTNLRIVSEAQKGGAPGVESSMIKIKGTLIRQELTDLMRRAAGPYAMPFTPEIYEAGSNEGPVGPDYAATVSAKYFNMRKISIFGGSNEIQRNIISKMMLGL
jgi:alkylation response protein AidB-like acyl-CoA dehydrogenase